MPAPYPFSWLLSVVKVPVSSILEEVGLDATLYVGFVRLGLLILLGTFVFDLSIVLWANAQGDGHLNQQTYTDLDVLSMGNVPARSPKLWVHLISVVIKTSVVLKAIDAVSSSSASYRSSRGHSAQRPLLNRAILRPNDQL